MNNIPTGRYVISKIQDMPDEQRPPAFVDTGGIQISTREKILKVALDFFLNNTYRDVSINDIVRAVGITKGGLYHYFKSKDDLFSEVVENFIDRYTQMYLAFFIDETMEFKQKLDFVAARTVELYKSEEVKRVYSNLDKFFFELRKHNDRLFTKAIAMNKEILNLVTDLFAREKQKGGLRENLDCEGTAVQFLTSLKGVAQYSLYVEEERLEKNVNTFMENFWRGIQAGPVLQ